VIELTQGLNHPMVMIQLGSLRLLQAAPLINRMDERRGQWEIQFE
jgi:hypothetical protein